VEGAEFNNAKRKLRACFSLNREFYRLMITDPIVERRYLAGEDGVYKIGQAILCISLGEIFEGNAYKLVATILFPAQGF
jgi:hypothetical protein